jgi:AmmeMemoRadiSam system protein B
MPLPERPQLRPYLTASPEDGGGQSYVLWDQLRVSDLTLRVTALELEWLHLFDGKRTLHDIQADATRHLGGMSIPLGVFSRLTDQLEKALFLDTPAYQTRIRAPIRPPACQGSYEADPKALREQVEGLFAGPKGPGLPGEPHPESDFRAALAPHIDYGRGGSTYAWAFKEVFERTGASLFVIIGTSHYSRSRFSLTRKHFQTPLGVVPTDSRYIDRLVAHYGEGLFEDELLAHLPEHSIELEVVFLQYLYERRRPFRIVPLVVGSFHDCVELEETPHRRRDIGRMITALQAVERETEEPICYLISGDLAHIGPKFGDRAPVSLSQLAHSKQQDLAILAQVCDAKAVDAEGYFRIIAKEGDQRRICGLPPTYTVLEAIHPGRGRLLHYDQYVHPHGFESVSFASAAFYR